MFRGKVHKSRHTSRRKSRQRTFRFRGEPLVSDTGKRKRSRRREGGPNVPADVTAVVVPPPPSSPPRRRRSGVPHETRPEIQGPAHVVLRLCRGLPSLRTPRAWRVLERCFRHGKEKKGYRLVEFSVLSDHLHLIVEVTDRRKLARGMQALAIRIAKALNRHWHRRIGRVFADRYFSLALKSRGQMWRTLRYVLNNARKHGAWRDPTRPDPYSSGRWFWHWTRGDFCRPLRSAPVLRAWTAWLAWPAPIGLDELPGTRYWVEDEQLDLATLLGR